MLKRLLLAALLAVATLGPSPAFAASITESVHTYAGGQVPSYIIETNQTLLEVIPSRGGRIARWIDKQRNIDLTYLAPETTAYGGILDDHGARAVLAYTARVIKDDGANVTLELTGQIPDGSAYVKTIHAYDDKPLFSVNYRFANPSQSAIRLLIRNVVRPGGGPIVSGDDIYCMATTDGVSHTTRGFGRTDNIAAPWMAFLRQSAKAGVATAFEGDTLRRLYSWSDTPLAPTYEFMFLPLEPGRTYEATQHWKQVHGFATLDVTTRDADLASTVNLESKTLQTQFALTFAPEKSVKLATQFLSPDRKPLGDPVTQTFENASIGQILTAATKLPDATTYVIVTQTLTGADGGVLAQSERALTTVKDQPTTGYKLQPAWHSATKSDLIPGWQKRASYQVTVTPQDKARGYVAFEPFGPNVGTHLSTISLDMAIDEPETFPIYIRNTGGDKPLTVHLTPAPGKGLPTEALTVFAGQEAPFVNWGVTFKGWKLPPGNKITIAPQADGAFWLRLSTAGLAPGDYQATLNLQPESGEPSAVTLNIKVHPIRIPDRLRYTLNAHMLVNYLCSNGTGPTSTWNMAKGNAYLTDLAAHGNKVMVSYGANALSGAANAAATLHTQARVRSTGQTLKEALAKDPAQFRTQTLPDLDFTYWNPIFDASIAHGMTEYRTTLGSTENAGDWFLGLAQAIYADPAMKREDPRHLQVRQWATGQIVGYIRDKGYRTLLGNIDDEIAHDKFPQWVKEATWARQAGFAPGVTTSNATLLNDHFLDAIAPTMEYWIVGTINKPLLDKLRAAGRIKSVRLETYDSSATFWRSYEEERVSCGIAPGYYEIDGCWIQSYYRWNQGEAIIFPSPEGPTSTAAWEGARDGVDDANLYQTVLAMVRALEAAEHPGAGEARARLNKIIGTESGALLPAVSVASQLGELTKISAKDTSVFREAKRQMLLLMEDIAGKLPAPGLTLTYAGRPLSSASKPLFELSCSPAATQAGEAFLARLKALDPSLAKPLAANGELQIILALQKDYAPSDPSLKTLAADLTPSYPGPESYVIRDAKTAAGKPAIVIIGADEKGLAKGVDALAMFVEYAKTDWAQYLARKP